MKDADALLETLLQSADRAPVEAIRRLVADGADAELVHLNVLRFATENGLDEERTVAAFLHASRLGIFEMSWNILCPSCAGVLDANATLKSVRQADYHCAFCEMSQEPSLDDTVEVTFTVSPRVRRIAAHDPAGLGFWDYHRQVFFGSGVVLPGASELAGLAAEALVEHADLAPGERIILSLALGAEPLNVFDPVTHMAHLVEPAGEPTSERRELALVFDAPRPPVGRSRLAPGPLRLLLDNRTAGRVLPGVFAVGDGLMRLIGGRRPYLTAKRLLSNQTFRDIYRTDTLDVDQRLKVLSLTFLFTDLTGSTALYERVGDLVAYDLVRAHFTILHAIVADEGGAVVKTIGDAVMATFPTPYQAIGAAIRMREAMRDFNAGHAAHDLILKIGIHEGPCLAVNLNDRQDYFGQTVNIASRIQELAGSDAIFATRPVIAHPESARRLAANGTAAASQSRSLRGIGERMPVYELR